MTKRKTAKKYLKDGGCMDGVCGICAFKGKCDRKFGQSAYPKYGLELAKGYLEKRGKEALRVEVDEVMSVDMWKVACQYLVESFTKKEKKMEKDEGWKEFLLTGDEWEWESEQIPDGVLIRYRPIQKAPVSHEDRVSLWWESNENVWKKVTGVNNDCDEFNGEVCYIFPGYVENGKHFRNGFYGVSSDWFNNRRSASIPPEKV